MLNATLNMVLCKIKVFATRTFLPKQPIICYIVLGIPYASSITKFYLLLSRATASNAREEASFTFILLGIVVFDDVRQFRPQLWHTLPTT